MITSGGIIVVLAISIFFSFIVAYILKLTVAKFFAPLLATPVHILAIVIIIIIMILYITEAVDIGGFYYWIFTEMGKIARGY